MPNRSRRAGQFAGARRERAGKRLREFDPWGPIGALVGEESREPMEMPQWL